MSVKARRILVEAHNARLAASGTAENAEQSHSYRRHIHAQAEAMARSIWRETDYLPFVMKK